MRLLRRLAADPAFFAGVRAKGLAAANAPTQERRAIKLAAAAIARRAKTPASKARAIANSQAALKLFWADPVRVAAMLAKRAATVAAKNKRKQMAGLQCPPEERTILRRMREKGVRSYRVRLDVILKAMAKKKHRARVTSGPTA